jgi:cyclopropane fatty-acyl-phospholipid synthase-like methyltransferase
MFRSLLESPFAYRVLSREFDADVTTKNIVQSAGYQPGLKLLDIGCGPGDLAKYVRAEDYVGVDISERYIAQARHDYGGEFYILSADRVDELPMQFDRVTICGLLHHLSDRVVDDTLSALRAILKPGGYAYVTEAVWPTHGWDLPSWLIRKLDRGKFVRSSQQWREILARTFAVEDEQVVRNRVIEYYKCVLRPRQQLTAGTSAPEQSAKNL